MDEQVRQDITRPSRRKSEFVLFATPLLLLLVLAWSWWDHSTKWIPLSSNNLAAVDIEQTLYEASGSQHYFVRFRIRNLTSKPLGINLNDSRGMWSALHPIDWGLAEGDHNGTKNGLTPLPSIDRIKQKERQLISNYNKGRLTTIPPAGAVDYYREAGTGDRAAIETAYASAPLWMKSKTFIPHAPFPIHFLTTIRGAMPVTDGIQSQSFIYTSRDFAMKYPVCWKQVPAQAVVITGKAE